MNGFQRRPLNSLAEPAGTKAAKRDNLPVYSVTKHRGFVPSLEYFKKQVFSRELSTYTVVEAGEFAYATIHLDEGSIGIAPRSCLISPMYTAFRVVSDDVLTKYLIRYLKSPFAMAEYPVMGKGSAERRRSISFERLGQLSIPLPPLPEQRRIVAILDKADALRAKRLAGLEQLNSLAQAAFLETFGDPATNRRGWPRQTLDSVCEKITDGEHFNPQFSEIGMPIVMAGEVLDDEVNVGVAKRVEASMGERFRRKCNPERDDVLLVSRGATIGRSCVVDTDAVFCLMGSVILIKPTREKIEPGYLSAFLKHPFSIDALEKASGSSAQRAIYIKDLRSLPVLVPPLSLQRQMSTLLTAMKRVKGASRISSGHIDALFDSLQHQAFSGAL